MIVRCRSNTFLLPSYRSSGHGDQNIAMGVEKHYGLLIISNIFISDMCLHLLFLCYDLFTSDHSTLLWGETPLFPHVHIIFLVF